MSDGNALDEPTEWQGFSKPERAAALPLLSLYADGSPGRFHVHSVIGSGGVGEVHAATQCATGRRVALKFPRPEGGDAARTAVLSEAWAAGSLDHPNVVRVHAVGLSDDGRPMAVLQYIEGSPWRELIDDPAHPMWSTHLAESSPSSVTTADLATASGYRLSDNIRILMQVASAVQHAHNHHILHRDLKSGNVMIGELGKVAIIDWGNAVSLREDPESPLPMHDAVKSTAGTPQFMAPEMTTDGKSTLSERTDVYLLGGILCEILTGRPPHPADNPMQAMIQASRGHIPEFPASAPAPLVDICRRALDGEPHKRQASAGMFRAELMGFMRQRKAHGYRADADAATTALEALVDRALQAPPAPTSQRDGYQIHTLYTRAELGFQQALSANVAREGIDLGIERCRLAMARYALWDGDYDQAGQLCDRLLDPPSELLASLRQRRADDALLEEALDSVENPGGRRPRHILTAITLGIVAAALQSGFGLVEMLGLYTPTYLHYAAGMGVVALALVVVLITKGATYHPHNRHLLSGLLTGVAVLTAGWTLSDTVGASLDGVLTLQCLLLALNIAIIGAFVDVAMWWGTAAALVCFAGAAALPAGAQFWLGGALCAAVVAVGSAWRPDLGSNTSGRPTLSTRGAIGS